MKTKIITKFLTALFLTGLFIGCEPEIDSINSEETKDAISEVPEEQVIPLIVGHNEVSSDDIPNVISHLNKKLSSKYLRKTTANGTNDSGPIIDYDHITAVLDTLNNTNYSINFVMPNAPNNIFYNLVLGTDSIGRVSDPIVLKFTLDEEQEQAFIDSGYDFSFFKGNLSLENYRDYFPDELFFSTDTNCNQEFDENGDPLPCDIVNINNNGSTSGGPSTGSFGGYGGGGNACTVTSVWDSCGGTNGDTAHSSSICKGDGGGAGWVVTVDCPNGSYTEQDHTRFTNSQDTSECPTCNVGPSGPAGINTVSLIPGIIESKIESLQLDYCSSQILDKLKSLQQNDMAKILLRFGTFQNIYDWELRTSNPLIDPNNLAETDWKRDSDDNAIDYNYLTYIKPSYVNQATQISIARTILHEMLHTYLISLVDDANDTGTIEVTDFPILWNALVNETYDNNPNRLQHEQISRKFIIPLKDALKEWDNSKESDQYYEDLAWGGLIETSTFNTLFPQGTIPRNRILNTNNAEDKNSNQNGVSPKGTPCN